MAPHYQTSTLIASPCYPDAIAWSSENLVAVASGHLVTILNPDALEGPRQLVVLYRSDPFPIGVVNREDLFEPCLLPTCLARDNEPCIRSISWSQEGFAPNSGCLLSVCTVDGHVKLFRSPICEFCDEWVEVADISQLLFNYYKNINFGEDDVSHLTSPNHESVNAKHAEVLGCSRELQEPLSCRGPGRRRKKPSRHDSYIYDEDEDDLDAVKDTDFSLKPCSKSKKRPLEKAVKDGQDSSQNAEAPLSSNEVNKSLPRITAKQYACRDALLTSVIVAWSPVISSARVSCLSRDWCILAVGSKSGNVSFWKVCKPECYTIDAGMVSREPMLMGILHAHKSWISAIDFQISSASSSKSSLLLVTGCSDGSVKIWSGDIEELHLCRGAEEVPFVFVAKTTTDVSAPVSSISLSAPARLQPEVNLAIGRVSGSLETWIWNTCSNEIENTSACHAHDQVVTGLSWGLDGHCLYSCSQDNSVCCWISQGKKLEQISMHTDFPEIKDSADLLEVSDRCFGLDLAPGEQMIAVVRSLDTNLLNPMYEGRTQKAVVEFTWIGSQFLGIPIEQGIHTCSPESPMLSSANLWGSNILWSLKKFETSERALVLWDIIAALQGLKKSAPAYLGALMHKWVSDLFPDDSYCISVDARPHLRRDMLSQVSSRKLHLLNIICRKVMLRGHEQEPGAENSDATDFWNDLWVSSERELRERLVSFTFGVVLKRASCILKGASVENNWFPVGIAQMDSWVSKNEGEVHNQLRSLRCRIQDPGSRTDSVCEYSVEEVCTYCSAPVPFESPDVARCSGNNLPAETHLLSRCRASMRLCSVLQPVWHCVCCGGTVDKLLPESFFKGDAGHDDSIDLSAPAVPLCPFCGILLQRSMPEFLMSVSPV